MANCFTLQLHAMTSPMHTRNVYPFMCARHHFLYRLLFCNNASSRHLLTTKQTNKSNVFSDKEKRQEIKSGHYYHRHYFCSNWCTRESRIEMNHNEHGVKDAVRFQNNNHRLQTSKETNNKEEEQGLIENNNNMMRKRRQKQQEAFFGICSSFCSSSLSSFCKTLSSHSLSRNFVLLQTLFAVQEISVSPFSCWWLKNHLQVYLSKRRDQNSFTASHERCCSRQLLNKWWRWDVRKKREKYIFSEDMLWDITSSCLPNNNIMTSCSGKAVSGSAGESR